MNRHQQTIWINVTTSANWHRPVVGIVRVEVELKTQLQKLYPTGSVKECVWLGDKFVAHTAQQKPLTKTAKSEAKETTVTKEPSLLYPVLPRRVALQMIAQGVLSIMPAKLRPIVSRFLRLSKHKIAHILVNSTYRKAKIWISKTRSSTQKIVSDSRQQAINNKNQASLFKAGDLLISVGLDWEYPYLAEFSRLQEQEAVTIVTCCYDLIPVLFPQYCVSDVATRFMQYFIDLANSSDLILCISKQSEKDLKNLINQTGAAQVNTKVFPLGDNVPKAQNPKLSDEIKAILTEPFILFVSTIERRKNHQVLYQAYHLLCEQGKYAQLPKLVFVGMQGWGVDELMKDIQLDPLTQGLIIQCHHVTDAELHSLYTSALCCVYPSLYEGWGLPVGEALALGKIVLSSDRGSLPEVGSDLVIYIDPWNPADWAAHIWRVTTDIDYQKTLSEKVKLSYRPRSWQNAAQTIKIALDKLLTQGFTQKTYYPAYDFSSAVGEPIGPIIKSKGKAGVLFSGPNIALPTGEYILQVWDRPIDRESGSCIISLCLGSKRIEQKNIAIESNIANTLHPFAEFTFELKEAEPDFAIKCELTSGELTIERINLRGL